MRTRGPVTDCPYFPCHEGLEDCTFCYCPFYPCLDEKKGRFIFSEKTGESVWDCGKCCWIHKKKVVERIYTRIRKEKDAFFMEAE